MPSVSCVRQYVHWPSGQHIFLEYRVVLSSPESTRAREREEGEVQRSERERVSSGQQQPQDRGGVGEQKNACLCSSFHRKGVQEWSEFMGTNSHPRHFLPPLFDRTFPVWVGAFIDHDDNATRT